MDVDPLRDIDTMYDEVASCNIVEVIVDAVEKLSIKEKGDVTESKMVEVSGSRKTLE